jgi:nucleoside 2-deoxyribosyltransferase
MNDPTKSTEAGERRAFLAGVYLCGPITGLTLPEATGWRRAVASALAGEARVIDPTRTAVDTTRRTENAATRPLTVERLLHGKHTVARDRFDLRSTDIVLACFLGARAVSIGAVGEIFWADAMGKPVIIVREEDNIHNHDMLNEIAGWIFEDLHHAIEQVRTLINASGSL